MSKKSLRNYLLKMFLTVCLFFATQNAQAQETSLYRSFVNPPAVARPHLWWHWMNGNITKDGIYKDLMWMHRIGIGGFHHFD
ncbi:glycosyl hydrolase, partial [Hoylesella saccharolytica]